MKEFKGFLFSKLNLIGSKSEGPIYNLQQFDYTEIPIAKKANLWEADSNLQKALSTKVIISGEISEGVLHYEKIKPYSIPLAMKEEVQEEKRLGVDLKLENEEIILKKMPPSQSPVPFKIKLEVEWPYRSVWQGTCPTSQTYEFFVKFENTVIWRWSQGKFFPQVMIPVQIWGGKPYIFSENWIIEPEKIQSEGIYTVHGLFIASGQEVIKQIQINFTH